MIDRLLKPLAGLLILGIGVVHLEQYLDFIKDVPTIDVLFLLNSFAAGAICVLGPFRLLPALGGLGLAIGSLVAIAISRYADSGLFDYREVTWRTPMIVAAGLEIATVLVLAVLIARRRSA
jgi:hypothetical protein